ncbi:MAG: iron chelate uptake ABC transporter family permease subunit [Planctomycetota bacterium]
MSRLWDDFVASFALFGQSYLTGLGAAMLLALVGVFALARRQSFLGVVVAQASTLGIAVVLALGTAFAEHHDLHGTPLAAGILFAVVTALLAGRRAAGATDEAVGVWVYVTASALAVLLLAHGPHGLEEIQRLTFSTLIGADEHDLIQIGVLLAAALALTLGFGRSSLLCAVDPAFAGAIGLRVGLRNAVLSVALGLCIAVAIHTTGTLFSIASLTLPPLAARRLARTMLGTLALAPLLAGCATLVGFVLANGYDYPLGQVAAAVEALVVACAVPLGHLRRD